MTEKSVLTLVARIEEIDKKMQAVANLLVETVGEQVGEVFRVAFLVGDLLQENKELRTRIEALEARLPTTN